MAKGRVQSPGQTDHHKHSKSIQQNRGNDERQGVTEAALRVQGERWDRMRASVAREVPAGSHDGPPLCSRQPVNSGPDSQSGAGTWVRHRRSTEETPITHRAYRTRVRDSPEEEPRMQPHRAGAPVACGLHPQGGRRAWLGGSGRLPQRVLGTVAMPQRNGQMWWGEGSV